MKFQSLVSLALLPIARSYAQTPSTLSGTINSAPTASPLPPVNTTAAAFIGDLSTAILYASLIANDNDLAALCPLIDPPALSNITGIDGVAVQREVCAAATLSRNATIAELLVLGNQKGVSYLQTALFAVQVASNYAGGTDLNTLCSEIETELINNLFSNFIDNFGTTVKNYVCNAAKPTSPTPTGTLSPSTPFSNTTGPCASPTGFANRVVHVTDALADKHYNPSNEFNTTHGLFGFNDINVDLPEAVFIRFCLDKCMVFPGCVSIFVNQGRPYPPGPPGSDTAPRWYCEAFDAPLSADVYSVIDAPDSFLYGLGINRACEGTFRAY